MENGFYFFLALFEEISKNKNHSLIGTIQALQDGIDRFLIRRFVSAEPSSAFVFYMDRKKRAPHIQ